MSDLTAYQVAAGLTDFISDAVAGIILPSGCTAPDRIYTSAGEPDAWNCGEIAVWLSAIAPTDVPNRDQGIDQTACASGTYVEVNWRLVSCISKSTDGKSPISEEDHEADAQCFYTLAFGIYRRIQVGLETIWDDTNCKAITGGRFELGQRSGGMLSASQMFRVQVDLTDPANDSS